MKPTGKALSCLFGLCVLLCSSARAQSVLKSLEHYSSNYPEEKIHVQFDKGVYNQGETIWFKAYITSQNFPSPISTNFFAELVDANGKVIERKNFPVYESTAAGSFDLPANAGKNGVVFRAFTAWQLNFDSSQVFNHFIAVVTPGSVAVNNFYRKKFELSFFPEGGELITDLSSVVAFAARDNRGFPANVTGSVKDASGNFITSFVSVHDGMGKFSFLPKINEQYRAEWKDEYGVIHTTILPAARASGVSLQVADKGGYIGYIIRRTEDVLPSQKKLHIIAQMHGQLLYRAGINLEASSIISGIIKSDSLTTGIIQFTLFDNEWKPLAERIVFVNKEDFSFTAAVNAYSPDLKKRGKNIIEVEVPDTLRANLSVSVTDAALSTAEGDDNIYTRLLLTGDLRGYIHNPAYYFSSTNDSVKQNVDLLMLTHGWRKYNWTDLAANKFPVIKYLPDRYLTLKGKVTGAPASQLQSGAQLNVILQTKDSARQFLSAPVSRNGEFLMDGLVFYDTISVYYTFNANKKLNRAAVVDFKTAPPVTLKAGIDTAWVARMSTMKNMGPRSIFFAQKRAEVIPALNKKIKTLEEVFVRSQSRTRETKLDEKYASGLFQSGNSRMFNLIDDPDAVASGNALMYLQGRVAGLQIEGSGFQYSARWRGGSPAFFIDEMPMTIEDVSTIPASDIAMIKIFSPPFMGAFGNGGGGAIAIYRKKGGDDDTKYGAKGLDKGKAIGYPALKQFYSPDYATFTPLHEVEDVRSTLYWQPYVLTDKANHRVKLEFYNNDVTTSYRIVMEGMNEQGKMTRVEKIVSR
jgi:hypothetical protein